LSGATVLRVVDYLGELSIFDGGSVVVSPRIMERKHRSSVGGLLHHSSLAVCTVVTLVSIECSTCNVVVIGTNFDGVLEHHPERLLGSVTSERCIVLTKNLTAVESYDLNVNLVIGRAHCSTVQSEPDDINLLIDGESYTIAGSAVAPSFSDVIEPIDTLLLTG